jgi:hypothetical protein
LGTNLEQPDYRYPYRSSDGGENLDQALHVDLAEEGPIQVPCEDLPSARPVLCATSFLRKMFPSGQTDGVGDSGVVGTNRPVHIDAADPTSWSCMRNQIFRAVARSLVFKHAHLLAMTLP